MFYLHPEVSCVMSSGAPTTVEDLSVLMKSLSLKIPHLTLYVTVLHMYKIYCPRPFLHLVQNSEISTLSFPAIS